MALTEFDRDLLTVMPDLRNFARYLAGNPTEADDLVQMTLVRCLQAQHLFERGTNLKAWTFTILRNIRIKQFRKRKFENIDDLGEAELPYIKPRADDLIDAKRLLRDMQYLPTEHQVVLGLAGEGLTYDEIAEVMRCKLGTVKSRMSRAREALESYRNGKGAGNILAFLLEDA